MLLNSVQKCLVATPVLHLPKVAEYLHDHQDAFVIMENITYDDLSQKLKSDDSLTSLFINPNAQGFFIDRKLLSNTFLKCINTCSTGTNHVDKQACFDFGIKLYSLAKDYSLINNLPSTSELAFGMLIALHRNFRRCHDSIMDSNWNYRDVMGHQISGSSIGVLGYGRLGKIFCKQLEGFGVNILVCDNDPNVFVPPKYKRVDIKDLFIESNAVALHIHSTPENKKIINSDLLQLTQKGFYLINTSRGDLVDEKCLSDLIQEDHLGGYGTDVLATEFGNLEESPILDLYQQNKFNILITPHVGGMTYEGQEKAFLFAFNKFDISRTPFPD